MSFKRVHTPALKVSPSSKKPEVITIGDSDEEESQDLFESILDEEEEDCVEVIDSDDLFSSPESKNVSSKKKSSTTQSPIRRFLVPQGESRCERRKSCENTRVRRSSSVFVSPRKSLSPRVTWRRRSNGGFVDGEEPVIITIDDESQSRKLGTVSKSREKLKTDVWAKNRMEEMADKFRKRDQIMSKLVEADKDFLNIVHGGAIERVQKKAKEEFRDGDVIRKQADRAKLRGVAHPTSEAYFDALELSPESKERRINEVSRVRVVTEKMPSTPENYWEIGFPTESEQRRRGLITEVHVPKKCAKNLFRAQSSD